MTSRLSALACAIGSLPAQHLHVSAAERKTLLVAGATAGMTAIFGTPVAAVLLAVELLRFELLRFELRPRSLLPVAVACAVAGFLRPLLMGAGPLFPLHTHAVGPLTLLPCALAGVLCGALAAVLSLGLYKVEDLFGRLPLHWMWWPALGGLAVGIGGWLQPRALGVGYDVIGDLLDNRLALGAVLALLTAKAAMWMIALGSGTSGGVLAPLLMPGAGVGVALGHLLPGSDPALWPLVCMAATLGATLQAPLTAVVFAIGLTGDADALLPLLATCAVAYGFTLLTMRRSIMTEKIARRGRHIDREYGVDPLERGFVEDVMTRDPACIDAACTAQAALAKHFGAGQAHRAYPVVAAGRLVGMVDRETLAAFAGRAPHTALGDLLTDTPHAVEVALASDTCRTIATRLARDGLERLPVVDDATTARLVGIVARSDLVKPALSHVEDEEQRVRLRRLPWRAAGR